MNTCQQAEQLLHKVEEGCFHLLKALHHSPEAVWGEIQQIESASHALEEACPSLAGEWEPAASLIDSVAALRAQLAKEGFLDDTDLVAFRATVSEVQKSVQGLKSSLIPSTAPTAKVPKSTRSLKTYVFYCSNHLDAEQFAGFNRQLSGDMLKAVSLPCSGKADIPYLVKAFETGGDGVVIVTCKKNECRHLEGSLRAHKRAEAVESLLEEIGLGTGRMAVVESAQGHAGEVLGEIKQFMDKVRSLPHICA